QLDRMFEKLPDDIRRSLHSDETIQALKQIEKKYNLPGEQLQGLLSETGLLMLGASAPQAFINNLEKAMGVPKEMAKAIAMEANEKIFRPVKESLKVLHALEKKKEEIKPAFSDDLSSLSVAKELGATPIKKNAFTPISERIELKKPEIPKKEPEKEPVKAKAPDPYRETV
ncbi:MAG: hypothetical protein WCT48_04540, partial [Candidatus Paceibacterota bacterium]